MDRVAIYQPLAASRQEIRVAHLQPVSDESNILQCDLETVSLLSNPKPSYETISYCWAEVSGTERIQVNGIDFEAPASAAKVLRRFRPKHGERVLWLDAICINQDDVAERSEQVKLMGNVYRNAQQTLIWLGDADDFTEPAFQLMQLAYDDYLLRVDPFDGEVHGDLTFPEGDVKSFIKFYEKPWFGRVWVVQEAALPPQATCYCGEFEMPWRAVSYAVRLFSQAIPTSIEPELTWSLESDRGIKAAMNGWLLRQAALGLDKRVKLTFSKLLENGRRLDATDVRDKVFGVLGLVELAVINREGPGSKDWLVVDYNKPFAAVFRDATRLCMIESADLHQLEDIDEESFDTRELSRCTFPSWVPRYDRLDRGPETMGTTRFTPCGDRPTDVTLLQNPADPNVLTLKGYLLGPVSTVFPTLESISQPDTSSRMMMEAFFADCVKLLVNQDCTQLIGKLPETMTCNKFQETASDEGPVNISINLDDELVIPKVHDQHAHHLDKFYDLAETCCQSRRLFLSSGPLIGLGPESIEVGDRIALLFGARPFFVVRCDSSELHMDPSATVRCRLVGQCYIADLMGNGLLTKLEEMGKPPQIIELW